MIIIYNRTTTPTRTERERERRKKNDLINGFFIIFIKKNKTKTIN